MYQQKVHSIKRRSIAPFQSQQERFRCLTAVNGKELENSATPSSHLVFSIHPIMQRITASPRRRKQLRLLATEKLVTHIVNQLDPIGIHCSVKIGMALILSSSSSLSGKFLAELLFQVRDQSLLIMKHEADSLTVSLDVFKSTQTENSSFHFKGIFRLILSRISVTFSPAVD